MEPRAAAPPGLSPKHATSSGDGVFYLPGRLRIGEGAEAQRTSGADGTMIHKRFWVRGHWRRPNPTWSDQRVALSEVGIRAQGATLGLPRAPSDPNLFSQFRS